MIAKLSITYLALKQNIFQGKTRFLLHWNLIDGRLMFSDLYTSTLERKAFNLTNKRIQYNLSILFTKACLHVLFFKQEGHDGPSCSPENPLYIYPAMHYHLAIMAADHVRIVSVKVHQICLICSREMLFEYFLYKTVTL